MKKLLLAILLAPIAWAGFAQQTIPLTNWKFQTGDNMEWVKPGFDDSGWKPIEVGKQWEEQGYKNYDGYAWYRIRFTLPDDMKKKDVPNAINFLLGKIDDCDQVFLNGQLLGQNARLMPVGNTNPLDDLSKTAPAHDLNRNYIVQPDYPRLAWGKENTLAIRVYDGSGNGGMMSLAYVIAAYPGATEKTPSRSEYFSWINNTNEGSNEAQTLANLNFFKWLHNEYGMQLDIYAFDAGAFDGRLFYGSMSSNRFKSQFPHGFAPITEKAKSMNTSLGLWGGPDGFGNTPEEEKQRTDVMVSLVRDYNFSLFKMDAVCGSLRPQKYDAFNNMMVECRKYNPNLILLNHRLDLGKGIVHSTTYLMDGAETYIDVGMTSQITATHNRAGALGRGLSPNLTRLTEDHGVCLSSCLDYWEDDLILQAFNRTMVVSPQIYGNPWLLGDDEYPRLARIFNLARKYRDILVDGFVLPENTCGPKAVSRGNASTRLLTFRNLSWNPVKYTIALDKDVGLTRQGNVEIKQYHPTEKVIGSYPYGSTVEIEVLPFRACLIKVTTAKDTECSVEGCNYEVVREVDGKPMEIKLLGFPGEKCSVKLTGDYSKFHTAVLDNTAQSGLLKGKTVDIQFPGTPFKENYHRKLGDMVECKVPENAKGLFEATCFAADNNALEVRSLQRSGPTQIPQVQASRDAFFNQPLFAERNIWDKQLFDGDKSTGFSVCTRWFGGVKPGAFRIDLGKATHIDSLVLEVADGYSLSPMKSGEGYLCMVSKDLMHGNDLTAIAEKRMVIDLAHIDSVRYFAMMESPINVTEVTGYCNGKQINRSGWRASNLFRSSFFWDFVTQKAWSQSFVLNEVPDGSYLCIAVNGKHGLENAYAALEVDGKPIGCPSRNPSYQSNVWEYRVTATDSNYTYYVPVTKDMIGKKISAWVLCSDGNIDIKPEVWITAYPIPNQSINLILKNK